MEGAEHPPDLSLESPVASKPVPPMVPFPFPSVRRFRLSAYGGGKPGWRERGMEHPGVVLLWGAGVSCLFVGVGVEHLAITGVVIAPPHSIV